MPEKSHPPIIMFLMQKSYQRYQSLNNLMALWLKISSEAVSGRELVNQVLAARTETFTSSDAVSVSINISDIPKRRFETIEREADRNIPPILRFLRDRQHGLRGAKNQAAISDDAPWEWGPTGRGD